MRVSILRAFVVLLVGCGDGASSGPPSWRVGGEDESRAPWGLAIGGDGRVYVSELFGNRVDKFTPTGTLLLSWGGFGRDEGQFDSPKYLDVDGDGNLYVADTLNHRVQKFSPEGAVLASWGGYCSTGESDCEGQFNGPVGVAVDGDAGLVFVADSNNHRVQRFDTSGAFLGAWGSEGSGESQFRFVAEIGGVQGPEGDVAVDATGAVYVVDNLNHRVQKFTSEGTFVTMWGSEGDGEAQFRFPSPIAIDEDGLVYVVDNSTSQNDPGNLARLQRFAADGAFVDQWELVSRHGEPVSASGIAIDEAGSVLAIQGEDVATYVPPFPWQP